MRSEALMVAAAVLLGCGVEAQPVSEVGTARQALSLPRTPIELSGWQWGRRLVPATARSAYLVIVQDPRDPASFLAWAYDVRAGGTALFFFRGQTASHLARLQDQVNVDVRSFVGGGTGFDPGFGWGTAQQVSKKPNPPPPVINDWTPWSQHAFNVAIELELAFQKQF